jgi:hypothetical protein
MTRIYFTAQLLTDAIFSERSASTGGHHTLDYIPGSALLGAVAMEYAKYGSNAFTVFHSGKVRFGNAYPLSDEGEPALPIPLAWHVSKGQDLEGSVTGVRNLIHATDSDFAKWDAAGEQQKQVRSGYFTSKGDKIDPQRNYRVKTAIDRTKHGMADEAQLFGYQSLDAGTRCWFAVDFDTDLPESLVMDVADALCGFLRIGHSRSAEYGRIEVGKAESTNILKAAPGKDLLLYCASDLSLADAVTGAPCLIPTPAMFGIGQADFAPARSYLRIRSYSPFNGTRRRFDLQRQVIVKGSVLVFERETSFDASELDSVQKQVDPGVGLYRQDGLGQMLVNPPFLAGLEFRSFESLSFSMKSSRATLNSSEDLASWLTGKAEATEKEIKAIEQVDRWINDLTNGPYPRNSQWGQLRNIALQANSMADVRGAVERLCKEGVSQKQWQKTLRIGEEKKTYAEFLLDIVLSQGIGLQDARYRLYLLGNRLPHKINQKQGR